jgi:hypothetical protein
MRRAYIDPHVDLPESFRLARIWAGTVGPVSVVGPSTSAIDASPWLAKTGLPIDVTSNRGSRYSARPGVGTVIGWCLGLDDILRLERRAELDGLVVVRGYKEHAPWITAHEVGLLGGEPVEPVPEATGPIKAMVDGLSVLPIGDVNPTWPHRDGGSWPQLSCVRGCGLLGQPQKMQVGSRSSSLSRSSTRFDGASGS